MPSEIKCLLDAIEQAYLTMCRETENISDTVARNACIMTHTRRIATYRTRLIEIIGDSAVQRVSEIIESAAMLHKAELVRRNMLKARR